MKDLDQPTEELFNSVDKARDALDELTLPKRYTTTIKRKQKVGNLKGGDV